MLLILLTYIYIYNTYYIIILFYLKTTFAGLEYINLSQSPATFTRPPLFLFVIVLPLFSHCRCFFVYRLLSISFVYRVGGAVFVSIV